MEENGLWNIRKVLIVIVQKVFHKDNIVNMGELRKEEWEIKNFINDFYMDKST